MNTSSNKQYKLKLLRSLVKSKSRGVCRICLENNHGKNIFCKLRRGTC